MSEQAGVEIDHDAMQAELAVTRATFLSSTPSWPRTRGSEREESGRNWKLSARDCSSWRSSGMA